MSPLSPELISLLAALVSVMPGLFAALTPETQASVRDQLARARTLLPPAGSVTSAVEAVIAKHAAAHPRVSAHHADVLARLVRPTSAALLSHEERAALTEVEALLRDITAEPSPLAPPVLFGEPDHGED